jgi:hypothetical protein
MANRSKVIEILIDELEETDALTDEEVQVTAERIADRLVNVLDIEDDRTVLPDEDDPMSDGATD